MTFPVGGMHTDGDVEIAVKDWDVMFRSLIEKLRLASREVVVLGPVMKVPADPVTLLQIIVLECVSALDQLHAALKLDCAQTQ